MLQVSKMWFLLILCWIVIIFVIWYCIIIRKIILLYYGTLRGRYNYEKKLWNKAKGDKYYMKILSGFYIFWEFEIIQCFKISSIVTLYKNIFYFNKAMLENIKGFYFEFKDIVKFVKFVEKKIKEEGGLNGFERKYIEKTGMNELLKLYWEGKMEEEEHMFFNMWLWIKIMKEMGVRNSQIEEMLKDEENNKK